MPGESRGQVLLADDDDSVRRPLGQSLRNAGFAVEGVSTGHEAALALERQDFDALLADISMPGNENLELVEHCGNLGRLLPVILMTGYPSLQTAVGALRFSVVDYLVKPIAPEALIACLDVAVGKRRALLAVGEGRRRLQSLTETMDAIEAAVSMVGVGAANRANAAANRGQNPLERLAPEALERLSPRERDVVRLLALGRTVQETSRALALSSNTTRNHIKSVFAKLRVRSQVALLAKVAGHESKDGGAES